MTSTVICIKCKNRIQIKLPDAIAMLKQDPKIISYAKCGNCSVELEVITRAILESTCQIKS
jgi:hypothetical protein